MQTLNNLGLAEMLYLEQVFGFIPHELKLHEIYKEAPIPEFYADIRLLPKGKLPAEKMDLIGRIMAIEYKRLQDSSFFRQFDYVIGVPRAAEVLAESFLNYWAGPSAKVVKLDKIETDGKRKVVPGKLSASLKPGGKVLMIDNVTSGGVSMLEAIEATRQMNLQVVTCMSVFDLEIGAGERIEKRGPQFLSFISRRWLLGLSMIETELGLAKVRSVARSIEALKDYLDTHWDDSLHFGP